MDASFLTVGTRNSIQALKSFNDLIGQRSERLATGLKVNNALDDPAAFFTARSLNDRVGGLNRVLDNIGSNLGTIRAAEAGVRALTQLVNVAQSIVTSAESLPVAQPTAIGSVDISGQADLTALAGVSDGDQFTVQVGSGMATTITVSSGQSAEALVAELDAIDNVSAALTDSGTLQISTTNGEDLTLAEASGTPLAGLGVTAGTFDQSTAVGPERAAKADDFNAILQQIDQLAGDASFLGTNLLAGDSPSVLFNTSGSSSLTLTGVNSGSAGLSISQAANGFGTNADTAAASAELRGALTSLRSFSASLTTEFSVVETRRGFTSELRNVLQSGADNLTLADLNEEGAALLALQTRSAFTQAGFSIVQESDSGVLRLFR